MMNHNNAVSTLETRFADADAETQRLALRDARG
jgi:hypothetical protein